LQDVGSLRLIDGDVGDYDDNNDNGLVLYIRRHSGYFVVTL